MNVRSLRSGRGLAWLAVCLLALPMAAIAQTDDLGAPEETDSSRSMQKLFDYGMCAVSIMGVSTGVGAALAVLTCGKAAYMWWTE